LNLALEIQRVRATTRDDESWDFMSRKMPEVLNNPFNALKSVGAMMTNFRNSWKETTQYFDLNSGRWTKSKGMMGFD